MQEDVYRNFPYSPKSLRKPMKNQIIYKKLVFDYNNFVLLFINSDRNNYRNFKPLLNIDISFFYFMKYNII